MILRILSAVCVASFVVSGCAAHSSAPASTPPASPSELVSISAAPVWASTAPSTQGNAQAPGAPAAECQLYCEPWEMLPRAAPGPDYTKREVDNANEVLDAMKTDLLACYKKRLRGRPDAHAVVTADILIGEDGHVRRVDTSGGATLGEATMSCIVHRIQNGVFEPPHGGGTIQVRVPFSLRRMAPDEGDSI